MGRPSGLPLPPSAALLSYRVTSDLEILSDGSWFGQVLHQLEVKKRLLSMMGIAAFPSLAHPTLMGGQLLRLCQALSYLEHLAIARPDVGSLSELAAAVNDALPLYRRAPLVLCQYDAHLWQFLVAHDSQGQWRCTAILDWEHADLDDPDWDLAQLDGFRFAPVGAVPGDFFAGYGRTPASPLYTLYRLERAAWILSRHASGGHDWLALSVPLAEQLIRGLLARPDELREQIR